ncbi:MAG: VWA domain-containing protein [Gammaproteobacteria bacterium]|nr:VWA domain-containing protein [Gammaproteobacteria bacterium]
MVEKDKLPRKSSRAEVDAFLSKVAATPLATKSGERGRLIFAMDATASREPTWDHACHLQAQMFEATEKLGGVAIQLCYYRGYQEFHAGDWLTNAADLKRRMTAVHCLGGHTQIEKVLRHALGESGRERVNALVFVGDCMEEEVDRLCQVAGELGLHGVPAFMFYEGGEARAKSAFQQIARLTKGAYCPFDAGSAQQLRDLLSAVAVYAAGGRRALEDFGKNRGEAIKLLTRQITNR